MQDRDPKFDLNMLNYYDDLKDLAYDQQEVLTYWIKRCLEAEADYKDTITDYIALLEETGRLDANAGEEW